MSKVIFFDNAQSFTKDDILVLNSNDENYNDFIEIIKCEDYLPKKIFKVNDLKELELYIILNYLKKEYNINDIEFSYNLGHFETKLNLFIKKFNLFDEEGFDFIKVRLSRFSSSLSIIKFDKVINFLDNIFKEVLIPFYKETPFLYKDLEEQKNKHWLEYNFEHENLIKECIKKLNSMKNGCFVNEKELNSLDIIINNYAKTIRLFNSEESDIENKLFILSAYFFSLSDIFFRKNELNISLTFLHRSMDIYLQYLAKKENIIVYQSQKLLYSTNKSEKIYLRATLESISNSIILGEQKKLLHKINDIRNYLLITHGVYGIKKDDLLDLRYKSREMIKSIEGNSLWETYVTSFFNVDLITQSILYLFSPSIDTYLTEVKTPAP